MIQIFTKAALRVSAHEVVVTAVAVPHMLDRRLPGDPPSPIKGRCLPANQSKAATDPAPDFSGPLLAHFRPSAS